MPRLKNALPRLSRCKTSGRALVYIDRRRIYLGRWGTKAACTAYDRFVAEWLSNGRHVPQAKPNGICADPGLTVTEVMLAYWEHVERYYQRSDGRPAGELDNIRCAMKPLKRLYGLTPAVDLGPIALQAVRQEFVASGKVRTQINNAIGRIKRMFRWAVSEQLIPPSVFQSLATVDGLRKGRSEAKEPAPVKPVPQAFIDAIQEHTSAQVWAMVQLQLLSGMRPGEIIAMRTCDVDTSGKLWLYRPASHKTAHHGYERVIPLGPRAQAILRPLLKPELEAFIFSPHEAQEARSAQRREQRKTPMTPSQRARQQKAKPKRRAGEKYTVNSYRRAIQYACVKAGIPLWHPHQLRHNAATRIRREHGLEVARAVLGHHSAAVTEIYAEQDMAVVQRVMEMSG